MEITYRTGDLLEAVEPAIVHGCNAQGAMGSGVARALRARYPAAYDAYRAEHRAKGLPLGHTIWVDCGAHVVIHAITQEFYGRDGRRYADYDAIARAFARIDEVARMTQTYTGSRATPPKVIDAVGLPLIGAGLAGGDWSRISEIVEASAVHFRPVVYLVDGKRPDG